MLGKYNKWFDELGHFILASVVVFTFYILNLINLAEGIYIFLFSILLDLDHLLNPLIAKLFNIKGTAFPSKKQHGYTIKILHGIDLYIIYSFIGYLFTNSGTFSVALFFGLVLHHVWDFIVYDHAWKELFLITRASQKFKPGKRNKCKGIIFTSESLPM